MTKLEATAIAVSEFFDKHGKPPTVQELETILSDKRSKIMRRLIALSSAGRLLYKDTVILNCKPVILQNFTHINWLTKSIRVAA